MSNNTKIKILVAFVFLLTFIVGYYRETLFLVINSVINKQPYPYNVFYVKQPEFLLKMSVSSLMKVKWILTVFFSMLMTLFSVVVMKIFYKNNSGVYFSLFIYGSLFILAGTLFLIGLIFGVQDLMYSKSRFVIGLIHSPLLCFIVFIVYYLRYLRENLN